MCSIGAAGSDCSGISVLYQCMMGFGGLFAVGAFLSAVNRCRKRREAHKQHEFTAGGGGGIRSGRARSCSGSSDGSGNGACHEHLIAHGDHMHLTHCDDSHSAAIHYNQNNSHVDLSNAALLQYNSLAQAGGSESDSDCSSDGGDYGGQSSPLVFLDPQGNRLKWVNGVLQPERKGRVTTTATASTVDHGSSTATTTVSITAGPPTGSAFVVAATAPAGGPGGVYRSDRVALGLPAVPLPHRQEQAVVAWARAAAATVPSAAVATAGPSGSGSDGSDDYVGAEGDPSAGFDRNRSKAMNSLGGYKSNRVALGLPAVRQTPNASTIAQFGSGGVGGTGRGPSNHSAPSPTASAPPMDLHHPGYPQQQQQQPQQQQPYPGFPGGIGSDVVAQPGVILVPIAGQPAGAPVLLPSVNAPISYLGSSSSTSSNAAASGGNATPLSASSSGSATAAADSANSSSSTVCPVCFDAPRNVVLRPCGHTLCSGCLDGLTARAGGNQTAVPCPVCRQRVEGSMRFYL